MSLRERIEARLAALEERAAELRDLLATADEDQPEPAPERPATVVPIKQTPVRPKEKPQPGPAISAPTIAATPVEREPAQEKPDAYYRERARRLANALAAGSMAYKPLLGEAKVSPADLSETVKRFEAWFWKDGGGNYGLTQEGRKELL